MNHKFRFLLPTLLVMLIVGIIVGVPLTVSLAASAPAPAVTPKPAKITGAVVFEVDGVPEWVVFVFEDGNAYILDTNDCDAKCDAVMHQLKDMSRIKTVDVITKTPDTKT